MNRASRTRPFLAAMSFALTMLTAGVAHADVLVGPRVEDLGVIALAGCGCLGFMALVAGLIVFLIVRGKRGRAAVGAAEAAGASTAEPTVAPPVPAVPEEPPAPQV